MLEINFLFLYRLILLPLAFHVCSITIYDFSLALFQVIYKITFVYSSISPSKHTITLFFISLPSSFIFFTSNRSFFPNTLTKSQSIFKLSFEKTACRPKVLPVSTRFAILVISFITIAICKSLYSLTMFQAFFEFTFIPVAIRPSVYTIPISFTLSPLSYVRISFSSSPNP